MSLTILIELDCQEYLKTMTDLSYVYDTMRQESFLCKFLLVPAVLGIYEKGLDLPRGGVFLDMEQVTLA